METKCTPFKNKAEKRIVNHNIHFPLPWTEIFWNDKNILEFQVHWQYNQKVKYFNKGRTHNNATFKEITSVIFNQIAKLTSRMEEKIKWILKKYIKYTQMIWSKQDWLQKYFLFKRSSDDSVHFKIDRWFEAKIFLPEEVIQFLHCIL